MKRILSLILAVLTFSAMLVSCTPAAPATPDESSSTAVDSTVPENVDIVVTPQFVGNKNGTIELTWQPCPAHSLFSTSEARVEYLTPRIEEWCKANPDVKINIVEASTNNVESMAKTLIQVKEGRAADIVAIDSYTFPNFAEYAQPIDDVLANYGITSDDFFPYINEVAIPDGKALGLWYTTDVRSLFYRKDLIPEAPKTWEELLAKGKEMSEKGYEGYLYAAGKNEGLVVNALPWFWAMGGELVDGDKPIFADGKNGEAWIKIINFMQDTFKSGATPQRALSIETSPVADMSSGQVAMIIEGNYVVKNMFDTIGEEEFEKLWGVAPIPMPEASMHKNAAGGWITAVFTKDEAKRKLAADFVTYIYGNDEGMEGWCRAGGYLPTRKSVYENVEYYKTDKYAQFFKSELEFAGVRPAAPIYATISSELSNYISEVLAGTMTAEAALEQAKKNVDTQFAAAK